VFQCSLFCTPGLWLWSDMITCLSHPLEQESLNSLFYFISQIRWSINICWMNEWTSKECPLEILASHRNLPNCFMELFTVYLSIWIQIKKSIMHQFPSELGSLRNNFSGWLMLGPWGIFVSWKTFMHGSGYLRTSFVQYFAKHLHKHVHVDFIIALGVRKVILASLGTDEVIPVQRW
jgi:hypothetical protein